jgi:putative PIN family toxin of toxin-antitoxin system
MKVVLDTNVLLVSFSQKSRLWKIFESFLEEKIVLCVTTDILFEYEEIITKHSNLELSQTLLQLITNAPNVEYITKYYQFNLIKIDPDDNKFVDCAIAANVKYIVTDDKHFNILKEIPFPKVDVVKADDFLKELEVL